ncbi:MAG: xanthine dehydrogenase family protein molybdopterin-binding subunit, partial [Alphaproteobacteria bacterium]|nr:xanthine dehydrogenase family protein molybdopterin-binding subunit [Alphaproteobacteria bacterium]
MARFGIGQSVRRTEDARLLLGRGRFVDDIALPRMAHAAVLRSPHAHADILSIDTADARAAPGVLILATAETIAADGLDFIPATYKPPGLAFNEAPMPILARGRVRHVGEPV